MILASGRFDQNPGIVMPHLMTYANPVCLHSQLLRLLQSDVTAVFINPDLNGATDSSSVHLHTLAGGTVYTQCFQTKIILLGRIEAGDFSCWKVYHYDMLRQTLLMWLNVFWMNGRKATDMGFCLAAGVS